MTYILTIETATTVCSVSVAKNGVCIALEETDNGYTHAENLHRFIELCLQKAGITFAQLNAIAVSKGPGSYTGLRIGVSAAKGFAFALNIPLISVNTLQIMAAAAQKINPSFNYYCPMIDARRMEVYTAVYSQQLLQVKETEALILDEQSILVFNDYRTICFFGNGMPKSKLLLSSLNQSEFLDNVAPSAQQLGMLAYKKFTEKKFEDVAYFEPFYLKDFMIAKK